jgi:hypothetical protein
VHHQQRSQRLSIDEFRYSSPVIIPSVPKLGRGLLQRAHRKYRRVFLVQFLTTFVSCGKGSETTMAASGNVVGHGSFQFMDILFL